MKCLVTGASGFIGSALSRELAQHGHNLVLMMRADRPAEEGTEVLRLELGAEPITTELLHGVEAVFHCAGIAHQAASEAEYRRINHAATLELAAAAEAAGARCFVFLSSVKADASATPYGHWKWQTEQALASAFGNSTLAVCSLRPALVYGPGVRGNLRTLIAGVHAHLPAPPQGGGRSLIGLNDLVSVIRLLGESPQPGYSCYQVSDGEVYSSRRIYDAIRAGMGKPAGSAWLPRAGWRLGCALLDLLGTAAGEGSYQKMFGEELFSNAAIRAALDWQPRYTLEEQIPEMLEDYAR